MVQKSPLGEALDEKGCISNPRGCGHKVFGNPLQTLATGRF